MTNIDRNAIPRPYLWVLDHIEPTRLLVWQIHITLFWVLMIPVTLAFLADSILWVLVISLWANIASHFVGAIVQFLDGADEEGNLT